MNYSLPPINNDQGLIWRPSRMYIPAMQFTGMSVTAINEGGAANEAYGVGWEGAHTGAPVSKEISTFGYNAILLDTAGDMVITDHLLPYDFDPQKPMYVRVHWASGSTDVADTIDWIVTYQAMVPEVTAMVTPATALTTTIAQDTVPVATAYVRCRSPWGKIAGGTIDEKAEDISWLIEMDAFAAGLAEDKFLLGLELMYTPRRMHYGDGMYRESKPALAMLGKVF